MCLRPGPPALWSLAARSAPGVFLLKLTPGLSPDLIPDIFRLYDCVIVESFGVGGIPQRLMDAFAEGLGDYDKTHKVLILTTQVTYEGSDVGIYEVGKRVKNRFRFLEAHDMTIRGRRDEDHVAAGAGLRQLRSAAAAVLPAGQF